MRIHNEIDLGHLIRQRRKELGLDQASLAARVGVSRQWLIEVEKGKPRAEIGLVLRTLRVLRLSLYSRDPGGEGSGTSPGPRVDIDRIIDRARDGETDG